MEFQNQILSIFASNLLRNEEPYKVMAGLESYRAEVLSQYNRLVKQKELTPIEDLTKDQKTNLKKIEKKYFTGTLEERMNFCRCVWLIENLKT